jgi:hypothetical protein
MARKTGQFYVVFMEIKPGDADMWKVSAQPRLNQYAKRPR